MLKAEKIRLRYTLFLILSEGAGSYADHPGFGSLLFCYSGATGINTDWSTSNSGSTPTPFIRNICKKVYVISAVPNSEYKVINVSGKVVNAGRLLDAQKHLDLSSISNGVYVIKIIIPNRNIFLKFVIK